MALHMARLPPPMHTPYLFKKRGRRVHKRGILVRMSVIGGAINKFFNFLTPPKHKIVCTYLIMNTLLQNLMDIKPSKYLKIWVRPYSVWFFIEKLVNHVHNKFLLGVFFYILILLA